MMSKFIYIAGIFYGLSTFAQTPQTLTGGVEVTHGVIQQLEDELANRVTQTPFKAADYKEWNEEFRKKLNSDLAAYEGQIEAQIVRVLQPFVDQYQMTMQDQTLSPEQREAFKATQITRIQGVADQLIPTYKTIYTSLIKSIAG